MHIFPTKTISFLLIILYVQSLKISHWSNRHRDLLKLQNTPNLKICNQRDSSDISESFTKASKIWRKTVASVMMIPLLFFGGSNVRADDELAKFAAEGNKVAVDGQCFMRKCALETSKCANDPNCLKGLSCLARCKGGSMCSTGCFAKYGSERLDNLLACSVEKNDCVQVPGKENKGWIADSRSDLPGKPVTSFDINSLEGNWYKVMGLDSRYDCFDCQKNSFTVKDKSTLKMEAEFRIPRPTNPGFYQNDIKEELHVNENKASAGKVASHMQSSGQMFGLTFWENWYVMGESKPMKVPGVASAFARSNNEPELKLIFYTGHTLQGSYKGAFLYSRSKEMTPGVIKSAMEVITAAGMRPEDFCLIRNQCFSPEASLTASVGGSTTTGPKLSLARIDEVAKQAENRDSPFWYLGQNFFSATRVVADELADWFQDPTIVSDWLINQQERMVLQQPLEVSPFASLEKR